MIELETVIRQMIDATNRSDSDALLAAFTDDAVLVDFGRSFAGKPAIARWNQNENIGTHNQIEVTGAKRAEGKIQVGINVTGNGYNGPGTLIFTLDQDVITHLLITE